MTDERSMAAKKRFENQFPAMTRSAPDSPQNTGSYVSQSMIRVPRDKYDILVDVLLKIDRVTADIRHCSNQ